MKLAAGLALALTLAACTAPVAQPTAPPTATPALTPSAVPSCCRWEVAFARDLGSPVTVQLPGPVPAATVDRRVQQRLQLLASGPRSADGGAFNVLPGMTARLATVTVSGDLATLDYSVPGEDWGLNGSATLRAFVQQVVFTATEEPGVGRVLVTQNGGRQAIVGGEGLVISAPQTRAGLGYDGLMPYQAARVIRMSVTGAKPLLIVNGVPDDWRASVHADPDTFTVTYTDPAGVKTVTLAIARSNIPPPSVDSTQASPKFHGDAASLYQVAAAAAPRSQRWLVWTEPGTWSLPGPAGVPYILSATGLTEVEFWRFADSLHPNQI